MAARTVVCPECSETLPYGRLSCPACGSLLASVAGGTARAVAPPTVPTPVASPAPAAPPAGATATATEPPADEAAARPRRRWRAKPSVAAATEEPQAAAPGPSRPASPPRSATPARTFALAPSKVGAVTLAARLEGTASDSAGPSQAVLGDWPAGTEQAYGEPSPWRRDGVQRPRDIDWDDGVVGPRPAGGHAPSGNGNGAHATGVALPAWAGGPRGSTPPVDWPAAPAPAASTPTPVASDSAAKASVPPPGAYLPPSGTFTARDSGLARGQLVHPTTVRVSASPAVANVPAGEQAPKLRPGDAPLLADLPFDAPNSLPGWLVAAGSAAAIAGFVLPWSMRMPGASGLGYLDNWGLAVPSHLLVMLAAVVTLALAILPNRVPVWLRSGVAGLVVGGLLLGIAWLYVMGPLGAMIGALAEAAAALLLITGGLLAVRPERHAEDEPAV